MKLFLLKILSLVKSKPLTLDEKTQLIFEAQNKLQSFGQKMQKLQITFKKKLPLILPYLYKIQ